MEADDRAPVPHSRRRLEERVRADGVDAIRPRHVAAYIAEKSEKLGAGNSGPGRDLLHAMFRTAQREELVSRTQPTGRSVRSSRGGSGGSCSRKRSAASLARSPTSRRGPSSWTLVLTGLRREELRRLRWREVDLVENVLRVRDSKSERGIRSIALSSTLAEMLWQHRRRSAFQGDDELVSATRSGKPLRRRHVRGGFQGRPRPRDHRPRPGLPRPQARVTDERGCRRRDTDCADDAGRPREHEDDPDVPAPGRRRVPR